MPENQSGSGNLLTMPVNESGMSRKKFLAYSGVAAAMVIGISSCENDDNNNNNSGIDLGSGDTGILNYAYALEQLEAAFYIKILQAPYSGGSATEMALLADIRDHEIAHREFFKNALGSNAIQALTPDFSSIDFTNRT